MRQIEFFFDYISPYAYLAWEDTQRIAREHDVVIVAKPILFAALLAHNKTLGPAEIPSKREYLFIDILRKAESLGVEIEVPASHPFNPLLGLRATCAANDGERNDAVSTIYGAIWREGADMSTRDALDSRGLGHLADRASDDEVKARLRRNTDEALEGGIFGVPTLRFDGELFWGVDNLPFLEARLRGAPRPGEDKLRRWHELEASATRPR